MDTTRSRFLSAKEVAHELGLSTATVARRLRDNSIPHTKLCGRVLIAREFVDELAASALGKKD